MSEYKSSIISLYGDIDNVRNDSKVLNEILDRQGSKLLLHVLAEYIGNTVIKYSLNEEDTKRLRDSLVNELKESITERT